MIVNDCEKQKYRIDIWEVIARKSRVTNVQIANQLINRFNIRQIPQKTLFKNS